ncbi:MAG: helix-turn-helix transcriptional regulator [Bdellovibrionaceae bacterium]|nr:helix-turn-helix transcriptional regulator [Pseudobdellovibrionaceae bacterium]
MAKKKASSKPKSSHLSSDDIKSNIVVCAKKEFALHGYQGTNLKDVASCAGVAGSLINYHYKDKEGLFKACVEIFAKTRMDSINRILQAEPKSREEMQTRIELFVEEMMLSFVDDPHGFEIISSEIQAENPLALDLFRETFLQSFKNACIFFGKAIENNLIDSSRDPLIMASLLFSVSCENAKNDHLGKMFFNVTITDESWRKKVINHIVSLFMNGVAK